jgi:hypothetical protein
LELRRKWLTTEEAAKSATPLRMVLNCMLVVVVECPELSRLI